MIICSLKKTIIVYLLCCSVPLIAQPLKLVYENHVLKTTEGNNAAMNALLMPYRVQLTDSMHKVIGFALSGMIKKQPESALGNLVADALLLMSQKKFDTPVDAALLNYGSIRSFLPKGDITVERIYEIIPFDNTAVLLPITGELLQQILNRFSEKGGCLVAGIRFTIDAEKKAVSIVIGNKPLQPLQVYTIVMPDFLANGGDGFIELRQLKYDSKNYLIRDALLDFIKLQTELGKPIDYKTENRIIYANH
ncbi:MAG: 5'-nucleotidase C-terminal domain-containing protein [Sphingobacteriia bacterium]|nr:5'-nucleotidase C-terminal domain-containing protein [Sphingobacteriia bacterium]